MRYAIMFFAVASMLVLSPMVSNAQDAKAKLIGKWESTLELDMDKLKKLLADQGIGADQMDLVLPTVKAQFENAKIVMEFKEDGTSTAETTGAMASKSKGKWKLKESDGDKLVLEVTSDEAEEQVSTVTLVFDGKDKFTASSEDLDKAPIKAPTFTRAKM